MESPVLGAEPSSHNGPSFLVAGRGSGAHLWQQRHGSKGPVALPWGKFMGGTIVAISRRGRRMGGGGALGWGLGSYILNLITRSHPRVAGHWLGVFEDCRNRKGLRNRLQQKVDNHWRTAQCLVVYHVVDTGGLPSWFLEAVAVLPAGGRDVRVVSGGYLFWR